MRQIVTTDEAPRADNIYSQAVIAGGLIFVAGQVPLTPAGKMIDGSTAEKVACIMANIKAILQAAGASLSDVVKASVFVTDMAQMPELNAVYPTYFTQPNPAREAVCVKDLPLGATIEISVIAAQPKFTSTARDSVKESTNDNDHYIQL